MQPSPPSPPARHQNVSSLHAPVLSGLNVPWMELLPLASRCTAPAHASLDLLSAGIDFFYLESGRILVLHADADGRERAMFYLEGGNLFNEAPAAAGFDAPNSPFYCERECVYYRFPQAFLHDPAFIAAHPDHIINLLTGLGIKILIHHTSLSNFGGIPAVARLSRFILGLSVRRARLRFDPAMSQEAMATLLGMNRSTIVRALRELKEQGVITRSTKHLLEISDLDLLRKYADY